MNIVAISGTLSHPSRTATLLTAFLQKISARVEAHTTLVNVADHAAQLGGLLSLKQAPDALAEAYRQVFAADVLVIGTPVYKASYTGLLKHFFDLIDPRELQGKIAVLSANGGGDLHALVIEHQLRPLAGFFGMYTVPTGLFTRDSAFEKFADGSGYEIVEQGLLDRIDDVVKQTERLLRSDR